MNEEAELIIRGSTKELGDDLDETESKFGEFWENVSKVMQDVADRIGDRVGKSVSNMSDQVTKSLKEIEDSFKDSFKEMDETVQESQKSWVELWAKWSVILSILNPILSAIGKMFSALFSIIAAPIKMLVSLFTGLVSTVLGLMASLAKGIISALTGALTSAFKMGFDVITKSVSAVTSKVMDITRAFFSQMPLLLTDFASGLSEGFKALADFEKISSRVNALLKSTGEMAGFSAGELEIMAKSLQNVTTFSKGVAQSAQAVLLRFFNLRGDMLADTLSVAADLAVVLGTDLTSAAEKLGRALNNPISGVKELREMGLLLWDHEKALIERMVMMGNVAGAQRYILEKLSAHIGGAAAEAAKTFSGRVAQINNVLHDMWKEIANALVPILERLLPYIKDGAEFAIMMAKNFRDNLAPAILDWAESTSPVVIEWFQTILEAAKIAFKQVIDFSIQAYTLFETVWQGAPDTFEALSNAAQIMAQKVKIFLLEMWDGVFPYAESAWEKLSFFIKKVMLDALKPAAELADKILSAMTFGRHKTAIQDILAAKRKEADLDEQIAARQRKAREDESRGESEAVSREKSRLEEMQRAENERPSSFWKKFQTNLQKNKEAVDDFSNWATAQLDKLMKPRKDAGELDRGNRGRPGAPFLLEPARTAGAFEGLEALNRRIQSAAAKSPELILMQQQNDMMRSQHAEARKWSERQVEATKGVAGAIAAAASQPREAVYA